MYFLPTYTPRLNLIEMLWRDLKRALAGSYFGSIDELKATIIDIVNNNDTSIGIKNFDFSNKAGEGY